MSAGEALEDLFQTEWPVLVAAAARITGDVDRAEEIVQDVLVTALARWPFSGIPARPGAWLMTACRNRARNDLRDAARLEARHREAARLAEAAVAADAPEEGSGDPGIVDDRLRLVFVCCHPVLSRESQVALTLRLVGGLSTREIARAFVQPDATVAQRLVRAKRTLADAGVAFELPPPAEWADRLPSVLDVVYLVFNEGHMASGGEDLTRGDLCAEAIRLGRLLTELLPEEPEAWGLSALMQLQASRLGARVTAAGAPILLPDQDRRRWDRALIAGGLDALARSRSARPAAAGAAAGPASASAAGAAGPASASAAGPLAVQAAIAACHAEAPSWEATDWDRIVSLYDALLACAPGPVAELNRAVAVAMRDGPEAGLAALEPLVAAGVLDGYHPLWATRADLNRRRGRPDAAAGDYARALSLATNAAERRFLETRLAECRAAGR